jgi:hypothetical protein
MGHERLGALPRTKHWRDLVDDIGQAANVPSGMSDLASRTLVNVRNRFGSIQSDPGVQAAFTFLLGLTTHGLPGPPGPETFPDIELSANPSPFRLTKQLRSWVDAQVGSLEYAELAKRAAADAIAFWTTECSRQGDLFGSAQDASQAWADARKGAAFSQICRVFLGKFVERYLKYFLEREASAELPTLEARERFAASLSGHVDLVARHAFESTKIAQSFAAGWFNKHARYARPDRESAHAFLAFALGKLRQELQRESAEP